MIEDVKEYDEFLGRWRQCPDRWKRYTPGIRIQWMTQTQSTLMDLWKTRSQNHYRKTGQQTQS